MAPFLQLSSDRRPSLISPRESHQLRALLLRYPHSRPCPNPPTTIALVSHPQSRTTMSTKKSHLTHKLTLICLLTITIFSYREAQATDSKAQPFQSASEWQAANAQFLDRYSQEKKHILSHLGPVLICGHDSVTLLNGPSKQTLPFKSALHDHLKTSDHEVLELYLILRDHTGQTLDSDTIARLNAIKK